MRRNLTRLEYRTRTGARRAARKLRNATSGAGRFALAALLIVGISVGGVVPTAQANVTAGGNDTDFNTAVASNLPTAKANDVTVDTSGNVYVAYGSVVRKYSPAGALTWTSPAAGGGVKDIDVAADGTVVAATDRGLYVLNKAGSPWGGPYLGASRLFSAVRIIGANKIMYAGDGADAAFRLGTVTFTGGSNTSILPTTFNGQVRDIAIDGAGNAFIVGDFTSRIVKLNSSQERDSSFAPSLSSAPTNVAVSGDGLVAVGFSDSGGSNEVRVYSPTGGTTAFGTSLNTLFGEGLLNENSDLVFDASGRLLVGNRQGLKRVLPNGQLDANFVTDISSSTTVSALRVQADGKILVGLTVSPFLKRLTPDYEPPAVPPAPTAVAGDGQATVTVEAGDGPAPTSFRVELATDSSKFCTVTGASGSCTVTGLTNGTAYTFIAIAERFGLSSAASGQSNEVTPAGVPPEFVSATTSANGLTVTLTYNEELSASSLPAKELFEVLVDGVSTAVSSVQITGSTVVVTLASAIDAGKPVNVSYSLPEPPVIGEAIADTTGNFAAGLSSADVTNASTVDKTRPTLVSGQVGANGTTVTLAFSEAMANVRPSGSGAYDIYINGVERSFSNTYTISGTNVTLTLLHTPIIQRGDVVTLSYYAATLDDVSKTNVNLQDLAGNDAESFTQVALVNSSDIDTRPPVLRTTSPDEPRVSSDGRNITLTYNEELLSSTQAPLTAFTVRVDSQIVVVESRQTIGDQVVLTLAEPVGIGQVVTVAYTAPASNTAATNEATQDLKGNDAASFTATAVINDSTQDITPPTLLTSSPNQPSLDAAGTSLALTFDETLAEQTAVPADFTVLVDGVAQVVDAVSVSGDTIVLTFQSVIEGNVPVTVSYAAPTADPTLTNNAIQDESGNDSLSFSAVTVLNNSTTDTRPPVLRTLSPDQPVISVDGLSITLTYSEALNSTAATPSDFEVIVDGVTRVVSTVLASGNTVVLTFATPIAEGQTVTASYTAPSPDASDTNSAVQDVKGNDALSFTGVAVTNNSTIDQTPPELTSAALGANGTTLTLTFDELLTTTTGALPLASQFTVTSGGSPVSVSSVSVAGSTVTLTLGSAVFAGAAVLVSYTPPAVDNTTGNAAIQDVVGNDAATLVNEAVTNNSTQGPPAYVSGVVQSSGTAVNVTLSKTLTGITNASANSWTFTANGVSVKCPMVQNWFANPLVFSSCAPGIPQGATVTVTYAPPAGEGLTSGGLNMLPFENAPVTNSSTQPADVVAPTLVSLAMTGTAGTTLELNYDETLGGVKPTPEMFQVMAGATTADTPIAVSSVTLSGSKVILVLAEAVEKDYAVTLAYSAPTPDAWASNAAIQDIFGNDSASITATPLVNTSTVIVDRTAPTLQSITTDTSGTQIRLNYDEALGSTTALPTDFVVTLSGVAVTPSSVSVSGQTVILTMGAAVSTTDTFTVQYTPPTPATTSPLNNAIQDTTGNDAVAIDASFPTTNFSTVGPDVAPPTVSSVAVSGTSVTLTFSEPLGTTTAPASAYSVFVGNDLVAVSSTPPVVSGNTVTLQLVNPVPDGSLVSVSYTAPSPDADPMNPDASNLAVQDIRGNDARSFDVSTQPGNTAWSWVEPPVNNAACINNEKANSSRQRTLPNGITYSIGVSGDFVCVDEFDATLANRGGLNEHFTSTGLVTEPTVGIYSRQPASTAGCHVTPTYDPVKNITTCPDRGFVTVKFAQAVTNPVLSFAGWGSFSGSQRSWQTLNLESPVTLQYLSGPNITVANNNIEIVNTPVTTTCTSTSTTVFPAACGSIQVLGTVSEVKFSVDFNTPGDRTAPGSTWGHQDYWNMVASITEDFGLVPMGYENPVAAHVVGALKLGSTVDADNLDRLYADYNEDAVAAGSPITAATVGAAKYDDGVSVWSSNPSLALIPGETYSVPVSVQGVEQGRSANLCGWIDFNRDGAFSVGERACATPVTTAGSSTTNLVWTVPADVVPGQTYSRLRVSYEPIPVATGRVGSGEVEDYSLVLLSPSIPQAINDFSTGELNELQTLTPLSNDQFETDRPADPATLKLCGISPVETPNDCSKTTLSVPGEGTYTVNPTTGAVDFQPELDYSGTATPITYQVSETGPDPQTRSAVIAVTVNPAPVVVPPPPTATPDETTGPWDTNQSINVITNDAGSSDIPGAGATLVVSSLEIACDPEATGCTETVVNGVVTAVTVAGEGTYTVDASTGVITFDPLPTFVGEASPVIYTVSDNFDQSVSSTYTPTVIAPPAAADDTPAAGPHNTAQNIPVLANDTESLTEADFVPTSVKLCNPATAPPQTAPDCTATTVTIAGEGTYTANPDGTVTFAPVDGFYGTVSTPVRYQVADEDGQIVSALITPSVKSAPPTATPDVTSGGWDETQSINVVTNDAGTSDAAGPGATLVPESLTISCGTAVDCVETTDANGVVTAVTMVGQGTYSITADGVISFDPLPSFEGTARAVTYTVEDDLGQSVSSTYTPTVTPPAVSAVDDISSDDWNVDQTISPLANDPHNENFDLVNSTLKLCGIDPLQTPNNCSLTTLVVPDEGTYTVNADGTVTFDPLATFTGDATPIDYQVADSLGRVVDATIFVTVGEPPLPSATNDTSSGPWNVDQVLNPVASNDTPGASEFPLEADTVRFCQVDDPATADINEAQSPDGCSATSVTIPGEGTYTVNTTTGVVTFDPLPTFTGTVETPVRYQVEDSLGRVVNATITPTVGAPPLPEAEPDVSTGLQDVNQIINPLSNDDPGASEFPLQPDTVRFCQVDDPATADINEAQSPDGCTATSVTIPGEGTYTVNTTTGVVTFDPLPTFTGTATPVTYQVEDSLGEVASSTITPSVTPSPVAVPDAMTGPHDTNQVYDPSANDTVPAGGNELEPTTLRLCATDPAEAAPGCSATTLTVADEGTYTVDTDTGTVTFDPLPTFSGTATPVFYQVSDSGTTVQTISSTITPTVTPPAVSAADDTSSGNWDTNQIISPLANDPHNENFDLVNSTLKLCGINPVETADTCSKTTLLVPDEGTYTVNADGTVTFDPLPSFTGPATPIDYQVADSLGRVVDATISVTVGEPPAPSAVPDANTEAWDVNHIFSPLTNDVHDSNFDLIVGSLRLCAIDDPDTAGDQSETSPDCSLTTLVVPGEGTYTVNSDGTVTFDPLPTFTGVAAPVSYQAEDPLGRVVSSTITPTVGPPPAPTAQPDLSTGVQDVDQILNPLANDTPGASEFPLEADTVRFCQVDDPATADINEAQSPDACTATSVTIPGEGTYTVNTTTGVVTFDPLPTFTGTATPVTYQVEDSLGEVASSTITPSVVGRPVAVDDTSSGPFNQPQSDSVLSDDSADAPATLVASSLTLMDGSTPVTSVTALADDGVTVQGVYTLGPDNTVVFTPEPGFVGTAKPVTYRVTDSLGQTATATYTPTIDPPALPVANPDESVDAFNLTQTEDVLSNDTLPAGVTWEPETLELVGADANGAVTALADDGTTQGVYTVVDDEIVFTPANGFVGTAKPVTYEVTDSLGRVGTSTYTPTVLPPAPPSASPDTSEGFIGETQTKSLVSNDSAATGASLDLASVRLCDPTTDPAEVAPDCSATSVTIDGVGTYSVVSGVMTFTPEPNYVGTPEPMTYTVADVYGQEASSTYTPTVIGPPDAIDDTPAAGPFNTAQNIPVLANDIKAPTDAAFDRTSVRLEDADGEFVTSVTTADGTYVANADGTVTFTPRTGFTGVVSEPVTYRVADVDGQLVTAVITPSVVGPPVAVDDTSSGPFNQPQSDSVLSDDSAATGATLVASSLTLMDGSTPVTSVTALADDGVTVQGVYTLGPDNTVVFTPEPGFVGTATPVTYRVTDSLGQIDTATYTPTINPPALPVMAPDTSSGPYETAQTKDVLPNDTLPAGVTWEPETLELVGADANGAVTALADDGVTVQGVYTVVDDEIVFTPANGFVGTATPVTYEVTDSLGRVGTSTYTPTVTPPPAPVAVDDTSSGFINVAQDDTVVSDDTSSTGVAISSSAIKLLDPETGLYGTSPVTTPEGTYSIVDGKVQFLPVTDFVGTATPVTYQIADSVGQTATATYTPTVIGPPDAIDDTPAAGPFNTAQNIPILTNDIKAPTDAAFDPTSVRLEDADGEFVTSVTTADGTYVANADGTVTFTPRTGFTGVVSEPVTYRVADVDGQLVTAVITPSVVGPPEAQDDATSGPFNQPQSEDVLANDGAPAGVTLVPESLRLVSPGEFGAFTLVTTVTVEDGVYSIDENGHIEFTPNPGFVGTADPVTYQVTDSLGQGVTATYTPTIDPPALPVVAPDTSSGPFQTPQTKDVLANDSAPAGVTLRPETLVLVGADANGAVTALADDGVTVQGVYTVVDDEIVFTPANDFVGTANPVTYEITDSLNRTVSTTYTPTVIGPPVAVDDATSGPYNQPQSDSVVSDDAAASGATLVPSLTLMDGSTPVTSVTVVSGGVTQGVYTLGPNNTVVFTPEPGFTGTATPVTYRITDSQGQTATATYTPTIEPPALPVMVPDTSSGPYLTAQTKDVLPNDTLPTGVTWRPETLTLVGADANGAVTALADDGVTVQGVYTVVDGEIVFTPADGFVGTATSVTYQATDSLGRTGSTTYTPTVDPIPVPSAVPDRTIGPLDQPQSTFVLLNDDPGSGATIDGQYLQLWDPVLETWTNTVTTDEGTYTMRAVGNPRIEIIFTPVTGFVGVATPVTYQMSNNFGQFATTTYTPEIRTDPPPAPIVQVAEIVVATLVRTGLGSVTGALALVGGLLGLGSLALIAALRSRKAPADATTD